MEIRTAASPKDVMHYTTERLQGRVLIQDLFIPGKSNWFYSHIDRIIVGGAVPGEPIALTAGDALRAEYFLQRREMGVINIGGAGIITVDGREYPVESRGHVHRHGQQRDHICQQRCRKSGQILSEQYVSSTIPHILRC